MSKPTNKEIQAQADEACDHYDNGTRWPGLCYEAGVEAALFWALGDRDSPPMSDE